MLFKWILILSEDFKKYTFKKKKKFGIKDTKNNLKELIDGI